jgi:hypothetical protein
VRSYLAADFVGRYDGRGGAAGINSASGVLFVWQVPKNFTPQNGYYYRRDKSGHFRNDFSFAATLST